MKCIQSHSHDPFFNLAAEEYLLKNFQEDFYFQYVNTNSVVIGKHQNALAEINIEFMQENDIVLARRISGGGAVYHDKGNVNYSFITNESPGDFIKFKKYTSPVIETLQSLGINATLGKRNEILVGKEKISGTASHVFKTRVLHHGTLLFNANLEQLGKCLYDIRKYFTDKAVKSVRSDVVNIQSLLKRKMTEEEFYSFLFQAISDAGNEIIQFSNSDLEAIKKLQSEKFMTWEWNYGYSPKYKVEREIETDQGLCNFTTEVVKGRIESFETNWETNLVKLKDIKRSLPGIQHDKHVVAKKLEDLNLTAGTIKILLEALF